MKRKRTAAEEHTLAKISALHTLNKNGRATTKDVVKEQGLAELRAKKALEDLVKDGQARKIGRVYFPI